MKNKIKSNSMYLRRKDRGKIGKMRERGKEERERGTGSQTGREKSD
jgi:hypothetical protein